MDTRIRLAVCNLQTGIGTTRGYWHYLATAWKYFFPHHSRPVESAARFLREHRIDIALLCEVEGGSRRTRRVDQVALLTELGGFDHGIFFPTLIVGGRVNQGNGLCARFPACARKNHVLPGRGEPRFLSEAEVDLQGQRLRLFVAHLALERTIREPQIRHIAEIIDQSDAATILAGDFNVTHAAELRLLEQTVLRREISGATFPSWRPRRALDHLFFSRHFESVTSYSFDEYLFADHLPLVVELRLTGSV